MKRFTKIVLILAAICFVLGNVIVGAATAMGGGISSVGKRQADIKDGIIQKIEAKENAGIEKKKEAAGGSEGNVSLSGENIRKVSVSVQAGAIRVITEADRDSVEIRDISEHMDVSKELDGDSLELDFRKKRGIDHLISDEKIHGIVVLPENCEFQEIELEVDGGAVIVDEVIARKLKLEVEAGTAQVIKGSSDMLQIECAAGAVEYQGQVKELLDVETDAGAVKLHLEGRKEDYNYELNSSAGGIELDGETFGGLNQKKILSYEHAEKRARLECSAGGIEVEFTN